jgi:hypothetical protein
VVPGAVAPVTPVTPAVPVAPGTPLKPAAAIPAAVSKGNEKTGTTAVKTPPPKETARITVKPSLPTARPAGAAAKPVVAVAGAAAAAGAVVAAAGAKPVVATPGATPVAAKKADAVPIAGIPVYEEEKSTAITTGIAFTLMLLTWGTAGILAASYFHYL